MFHSRNTKNKINKLHESSLRLVHDDDYISTSKELLEKDESFTDYRCNKLYTGTLHRVT